MAEPLLRRTFSRLRGRDRPRGKKADGKEREHPPSSPDSPVEPEATPAEPVPVTPRKHHRGRFSCGGREERPPKSSPDPSELAPAAGVDPPQGEDDLEPAEEAEAVNGSGELGGAGRSPGTGRNPGPGAYLQSLERSSRHWVLSGGPGWEEPGGGTQTAPGAAGSEGEIWYNPIPEDEDPQVPGSSRKTGGGGNGDGAGESPPKMGKDEPPRSGLGTPEGSGPRGGTAPAALPTAGRGEEAGTGRSQACGKMPIPCVTSGLAPSPPSPPASPKKGRSLSKVKSPGTVRRLSMKMKKLPELRRKLSLRSPRPRGQEGGTSSSETPQESSNVISRYHLDTSVASGPGLPRAKGASKGGYLSDGDSPELLAKNGARDRGEEEEENGLDVELFRPYNYEEAPTPSAPGGGQHISGLVTVHLHGLGDLKPPRAENREVFCLLQVDAANRARTALLPLKKTFLGLNHTFNLELESARHLKVLVFSWDPTSCRNRLCCHGTVVLPHIFRGCRAQRLAVRLTPRGVLYSKLTLVERWEDPSQREPRVFGVELGKLVEREKAPTKVPLIIQKCLAEIEKRGLKVVGLYQLCGVASSKKWVASTRKGVLSTKMGGPSTKKGVLSTKGGGVGG
ncbi:PREDICTED: rho GTPase-activating protein SYDE1-like [Calidris pugnax]|uniref:rho GTPase-activating protein SYDE1-like n=1 Tax=Calidris pugnax TaxID=198806 RepID=UPI00071DDF76|nr:PREDICTED: rho GTPase-activating protein SYDE1-like [Calidris pugnax]